MRMVFLLFVAVLLSMFALPAQAINVNDPNLRATATTFTDPNFLVEPAGYGRDPNTHVKWATDYTIATHVPTVDFVVYPHEVGNYNWTHWGTGTVASTGKVYSAIGNHEAAGNSYIYEYDPVLKQIRCVGDARSALLAANPNYKSTDYGPGKIHGRVDEGSDGSIYCSGWWGPTPSGSYPGDHFFKYDPATGVTSDLGVYLPGTGAASTRINANNMYLYAESDDPDSSRTEFVAFNINTKTTIFHGAHTATSYGRDMFVDLQGKAYFNNGDPSSGPCPLQVYDPVTNAVSTFSAQMPEKDLRRATSPDPNTGVMYGLTKEHFNLFKLDPNTKTITNLTTLLNPPNSSFGELADMELDPTGRYIYYIPTKGYSIGYAAGVPLIQVDLQTMNGLGKPSQKIIAFLDDPIFDEFNVQLRGSWNVTISDDGRVVYAELTGHIGGMPNDPSILWHDTAFAAIHIPDGEAVFVPEPVTMSLLALGGLALLRRRSGQVLRKRARRIPAA